MMKLQYFVISLFITILLSCKTDNSALNYESQSLKIEPLTQNTFRHISYLPTKSFGNVGCNGMIVVDHGEALILDTPTYDSVSVELLNWIENELNCKPIGVVVTHFHEDCLGGLNEFHQRQIPSYASFKTITLAMKDSVLAPQIGFEESLSLKIGDKEVINQFLGEGHTRD